MTAATHALCLEIEDMLADHVRDHAARRAISEKIRDALTCMTLDVSDRLHDMDRRLEIALAGTAPTSVPEFAEMLLGDVRSDK